MSTAERNPWDQLADEPGPSYGRFLIYQGLGPGRSLDAAYRAHLAAAGEVVNGAERCPGSWQRESVLHRWPERAAQWDIANLRTVGRQTAVLTADYLAKLALKGLEGLAKADGPTTWEDCCKLAVVLMAIVPPHVLWGLIEDGGQDKPAGSAGRSRSYSERSGS